MKRFLTFAVAGLLLLQLFLILGKWWWFFELFTHYSVYYVLTAILLILFALPLRAWKSVLILVTLLSINLASFAPYLSAFPTAQALEEPTLSILSQNFYFTNDNFDEVQTILVDKAPDIFVIHEAGPKWRSSLPDFAAAYPNIYLTSETGVHGILLGSKVPGNFEEIPLGSKFGLEFIPNSQNYRVLAVHPFAPITEGYAAERNAQFADIVTYVKSGTLPTLVVGDFNSAPWSPYFQELLKDSDLADARLGFGLVPTWHAHNFFFRLPIDYVLTTPDWETLSFGRTAKTSADHWGIFAELKLNE